MKVTSMYSKYNMLNITQTSRFKAIAGSSQRSILTQYNKEYSRNKNCTKNGLSHLAIHLTIS